MASLPYPRSHKTIFPQNPTQPNHLCASVRICGRLFSARSFCVFCAIRGRTLRSHQTIFPQNSRNTQKRLAEKKNLCTSVKSVGEYPPPETSVKSVEGSSPPEASVYSVKSVEGYSPPEASVYSVKSVGEYPPPEASVYSVKSVGGLAQTNLEWVLWKEFGGQRGYGSHKTIFPQNSRNTQKRLAEKKNLCTSVKSVGEYPPPEASVYSVQSVGEYPPPEASVNSVNSVGGLAQTNLELFCGRNLEGGVGMAGMPYPPTSVKICAICGRIFSARSFCEFCEFRGRTCVNKLGVGSMEGIRRAAWVWQGCHTLLRKLPRIARMRTD